MPQHLPKGIGEASPVWEYFQTFKLIDCQNSGRRSHDLREIVIAVSLQETSVRKAIPV